MNETAVSVESFFYRCCVDGRAVLVYSRTPDEAGAAQPALWICRVGRLYVACDHIGPDRDWAEDDGFLQEITKGQTIQDVRIAWQQHRARINEKRRKGRKNARDRSVA